MTKADIVSEIAKSTGVEKVQVQAIVEAFMESIKTSLTQKNNVYLRGFGSFIVKKRAKKVAYFSIVQLLPEISSQSES